jgi:hypothetical protein
MTELRIGAAILREAMHTAEKEEDEGLKVRTAKAEEEMRKKRVSVCSLSTVDIFRPLEIQYFFGFRQRKRFWMTVRRRCFARSEKGLSGTSNKRGKTRLSCPRRREQDFKVCPVFCSLWVAKGHQSIHVSSSRTRIQLPAMSVKCCIT